MKWTKDENFVEFLEKFGKNLKSYRNEAGLTQENMAEKGELEFVYKYYQEIEYGNKNITLWSIYKLCKKLKITPQELFDFYKN